MAENGKIKLEYAEDLIDLKEEPLFTKEDLKKEIEENKNSVEIKLESAVDIQNLEKRRIELECVNDEEIDIKEEPFLTNKNFKKEINKENDSIEIELEKAVDLQKLSEKEEIYIWGFDMKEEPSSSQSKQKRFQCALCWNKFSRRAALKMHLKSHKEKKPNKCKLCDANFKWSCDLERHIRTHTKEKPFKCEVCEASFARLGDVKMHMRVHTGEKPFKCEFCEAKFAWPKSLATHRNSHCGMPYKCEVCEVSFTRSDDRKKHMRIHTGEKPFQCEICKAKFIRADSLKFHIIMNHSKEKPYKCDFCEAQFVRLRSQKAHMKIHTQ